MTIYEIDQSIAECVDEETGEVIDFERLSALAIERDKKIDNVASWYKSLNAEADAIDGEIEALEARKKSKKTKSESLKAYLSDILSGSKFETARNKITFILRDAVSITDEKALPTEYINETITTKPDKKAIATAIKAGRTVVGAELVKNNNIQIK